MGGYWEVELPHLGDIRFTDLSAGDIALRYVQARIPKDEDS